MYQLLEFSRTCYDVTVAHWLTAEEQEAWKNLQLMQLQLSSELNRRLAPFGLTLQDYYVLAHLDDQGGRMRIVELGRDLGLETSRASHHVSRLVQRGLLVKERCPQDGRGFFATLTEAGRGLVAEAAPSHVSDVQDLFIRNASPTQLRAIAAASKNTLKAIRDVDHQK